ncbi:MAG: hypothetical protein RR736_10060 [Pseudomonas sp.]|uniref:hypothetical protein n=1 Tax=Pseudomonas sp. TaxID=306 RepID=UPI002FC95158
MRITPLLCLFASLTLLGGCFDRDPDHPAKDADQSKPSLQMQKPDEPSSPPAPDTPAMPPKPESQ